MHASPAPHESPTALLTAVMVAVLLAALDQTIVATALPRITDTLGGHSLYAWAFTSYMVATIVFVPISGTLGDVFGRRPVLLWGVGLFALGSLLAGQAQGMLALVAWRALQGVGAGVLTANSFALLGDLYPPENRGRATGLMTAVYGLAGVLGPPLGGILTDSLGWRWIFWCNVPAALMILGILWWQLPHKPGTQRDPIDIPGAVLLSGFLLPAIALLSWAGEGLRFDDIRMQIAAALAIPCAALFVFVEKRAPRPVIEMSLFRNTTFSLALTGMFSVALAMYAALTYAPLLFQKQMHMSPTQAGMVTAPLVLALAMAAGVAGRLMEKGPSVKLLSGTGVVVSAAAMVWLSSMEADAGMAMVGLCMAALGAGLGLTMPTLLLAAQAAVPHEFLGVTTALAKFFRSVGGLMGVVLAGALIRHFQLCGAAEQAIPHTMAWAAGVMLVSLVPVVVLPVAGSPVTELRVEGQK